MITAERLRELVEYDPNTGVFVWRKTRHGMYAKQGAVCGAKTDRGYLTITVDLRRYRSHRLAWLYSYGQWPSGEIDHINGVKDDNRLANLRDATLRQNRVNVGPRANNKCGAKGVYWDKGAKKWRAAMKVDNKTVYLGLHPTKEAAHEAYCKEAKERYGEFARFKSQGQ